MDPGSRFYCPSCKRRGEEPDSQGSPSGPDYAGRALCPRCGAELVAGEAPVSESRKLAELRKFGLLADGGLLLEPKPRQRGAVASTLEPAGEVEDPKSR